MDYGQHSADVSEKQKISLGFTKIQVNFFEVMALELENYLLLNQNQYKRILYAQIKLYQNIKYKIIKKHIYQSLVNGISKSH